ncbi:Protein lifeguard 1 [Frankliniella fusca]|uniref:Protein lifeguard 1 n=1 Tax=Frankliniella fusca TaxID=407009 RepID=A0AAE1LV74_9NEOP|nr:Protein lifeguard 1 [Frankliniella fusca]
MKSFLSCVLLVLPAVLAFGTLMTSGEFLDEPALAELAEREGYALTMHALQRARRQADDQERQCRCPPPGPPPFPGGDDDDTPPPPPSGPDGSSEEGGRPRGPPPPRGCWPPPPPPGPWGPQRHHRPHPHRMGAEYQGPPCKLRPLFRVPDKFNFTARVGCFDRWERDSAKEMGMAPEDRFDVAKYKPTQRRSLMWNKGCDMQCHFLELELLTEDGKDVVVDAEAMANLLKEEGDSSDITAAVDAAIKSCMEMGAEMVHAKQVCQSGADEILFCLQRTLEETCPGSKWQGHRSCDEIEDAASKLRTCWHARRLAHPHPPPPPHFFDGRRGPPPHFFDGRRGPPPPPFVRPGPSAPAPAEDSMPEKPNTISSEDASAAKSEA